MLSLRTCAAVHFCCRCLNLLTHRSAAFRHDLITSIPDDTVGSAEAFAKIVEAFRDAERAGERVAVHCRGGEGRTGNAIAAWLIARHGMSPAEAEAEVLSHAAAEGAARRCKASKLQPFADSLKK